MKNIITYGTFDLLHVGHINLLRRARSLGNHLIVALSTDSFNQQRKNKSSIMPYQDRKQMLEALRWVDQVIPEECWEQKQIDVETYGIDTFVIGDDWEGKFDFLRARCNVVYLPRTENISSTFLKAQIRQGHSTPMTMANSAS